MEIEGKAVYLSDVHEFILNYNLHKLEYWQNSQKKASFLLGTSPIRRAVNGNFKKTFHKMSEMYLSHRANINEKTTSSGKVVIYEDHRTILNVLYLLKKEEKLECPINIILFDDHDDGCVPSKIALKIIEDFNENLPEIRDFWSFTEFDLKFLDDDWIKAGMELNLINHVFLFNSTQSSISFVEEYKTKKFGTKKIYNLGNVWDVLSYKGYLNDAIKEDEYGKLWKDFGWIKNKDFKFEFKPKNKFIVDFDLDCFSIELLDNRIAIPDEILYEKMTTYFRPEYHYFGTAQIFIKHIIDKAEFATICFENNCCGGYQQSFKIFENVNDLFFENEIK